MKVLLSIFLMLSLMACSGSKSTNEADEAETGVELADADEFSEEDEEGDELADEKSDEASDEFAEEGDEEEVADNSEAVDQDEEMTSDAVENEPETSTAMSGEEGVWTVTNNETLMIIAFKIYGDYDKWKELARLNRGKLGSSYHLSTGMKLKYNAPSEPFVWNPEGNPYLIRMGDTLGRISHTTYGTKKYWNNIWQNNKPLIKDPNKIFAGFTIYTPLIEGRDVANQ
jgi:nucleoid-associated protein YgaU